MNANGGGISYNIPRFRTKGVRHLVANAMMDGAALPDETAVAFDVHQSEPLRVTVSIGAYLVTPTFHDMKAALNNADQALYKAKEGGRNQVIEYKLEQ